MKPRYLVLFILCCLLARETFAKPLTIERIYESPALWGATLNSPQVSPDGQRVTFLRGKASDHEVLDLWEYHVASGQIRLLVDSADFTAADTELSDEEKARRERQRISNRGIISYQWSRDGSALLFPLGGDLYYYRLEDNKLQQLTDSDAFETDPRISPGGAYVSFIRDRELFVLQLSTGEETRLTHDSSESVSNGMAEFVAQEEMGRHTGYWWAPDDSALAYMQVDESGVEQVTRSEIYAEGIRMIDQRYPYTGKDNARVRLGLIPVSGGESRWLAEAGPVEGYLPRVHWLPDSSGLTFQWQSRDQHLLELRLHEIADNRTRTLLSESSENWVNLQDGEYQGLYFLKDGQRFLWQSERDGYNHLYLYNLQGEPLRQLTAGPWVVNEILAVDEKADAVYFTANRESPLEQQLYAAPLSKVAEARQISQREGWHQIQFAADGSAYVDSYSNANTPLQVSLHRASGERITWLAENRVQGDHPLQPYRDDWIEPEFGSLKSDDGVELYYRLFKPRDYNRGGKFPAIVFLYGGPGVQVVTDAWPRRAETYLYLQYLAQQGYVVFSLDNRGSKGRGTDFEQAIYRQLGQIELRDQVTGARFLRSLPYVDAERIGIHGHSYGGYMTLMSMLRAGEYFAAGIAGAPVTAWELYDTHYTERYMGTPASNPDGYRAASVLTYAGQLRGSLLIYHGMADDNVLFTHSTRLYKALQDAAIPFEVMDYPGKKHSIKGKNTGIHLRRTMSRFFDRELR